MNIFSGIKLLAGGLKNLFGGADKSGKALALAETTLKGVGTWIDEKKFTDEEKSKAYMEAMKNYLEFVKLTADENTIRSTTRRWLAWGITAYILIWASVAMVFAIMGEKEVVASMIEVTNKFWLGEAFGGVLLLYFGVSFIRK